MLKKMLLLLILGLIFSTQAYSQSIAIGPQVGYYKAKDADEGSLMFGGMARLYLGGAFAVEGAINYRKEEYMDGAYSITSYPVQASALIYVLPIAYGIAGIGWYNAKYEAGSFSETFSDVGYHIGGGAEIPLGSLILTGDIRYVFLKYQFDTGYGSMDVEANFFVITAGLLFSL